jgi:hypothetical protein
MPDPDPDLVEKVAKAIYETEPLVFYSSNSPIMWSELNADAADDHVCEQVARQTRERARAAIKAMTEGEPVS